MNKISLTLCAVLASLIVTIPLQAQSKTGTVRGSYINLRTDAKFNSPIIGKKVRGDQYKILFEDGNWLKVAFTDGTTGWLFRTMIEKAEDTAAPEEKEVATVKPPKAVDDKAAVTKAKTEKQPEKKSEKKPEKKPELKTAKEKKEPAKPDKLAKPAAVVDYAGSAEEIYNEAIKLYEAKKYVQALEKNQLALKKAPQNAEILNNVGNCLFKLGRVEEALEYWKNALKISPRSGKICNNLGIAYYQLDKNKDAVEYYKKATLFEPEFPDPYYNLASVQGFTGKFADAIVSYRKFLEFSPDLTMKKLAEERIAYCERQITKTDKSSKK